MSIQTHCKALDAGINGVLSRWGSLWYRLKQESGAGRVPFTMPMHQRGHAPGKSMVTCGPSLAFFISFPGLIPDSLPWAPRARLIGPTRVLHHWIGDGTQGSIYDLRHSGGA